VSGDDEDWASRASPTEVGEGAHTVLGKMVGAGILLSGGGSVPEGDALQYARRSIAIALVQGNARLISNALALARRPGSSPAAQPHRPAHRRLHVRVAPRPHANPPVRPDHGPAVPMVFLQQQPRTDHLVRAARTLVPRHWSSD
jgi:hypothetical protein